MIVQPEVKVQRGVSATKNNHIVLNKHQAGKGVFWRKTNNCDCPIL